MSDAPYFDSGGFLRGQESNAIGVFLVDLDGTPYVASGGGGGGGGLVQMQFREGGAWVNAPGTAAEGLLVDPISGVADGTVGLPPQVDIIGGYDGTNSRALKVSAAGVLQADILSLPTVTVQDGGGALTVDGAVSLAAAIPAGTNNIGDVDVLTLPANASVNLNQIAGTGISVGSGVLGTGTQRVVLATDQPSVMVRGEVAHDGVDSGNPQKIGGKAEAVDFTAVADGDRTDALFSLLGKQVVLPYATPGRETKGSANSTGTGDTSVIAAPGAGLRLYITTLIITNAHASTGTKVQIKSGTTTTGYPRVFAAANGGGASINFPKPLRLGANEALQFANVTTGADVDVSAQGYIAGE